MPAYHRRVTPKVVGDRPLRKNRHVLTPNIWSGNRGEFAIERERPGRGFRHLLRKQHIEEFIAMIPDWDHYADGLKGVVLAEGEHDCFGWYYDVGVIGICAWERQLWTALHVDYFNKDKALLKRLGVACEQRKDSVLCRFTEGQARAFLLLEVFLHELGHHHDRMTTKSRRRAARGEPYAERYSLDLRPDLWEDYVAHFGLN